MWKNLITLTLAAGLGVVGVAARADHEKPEPVPADVHGGDVVTAAGYEFEVLFTGGEARVYVYDGKEKALEPKDASVRVVITPGKKGGSGLDLAYVAPDPEQHRGQGYFAAAHGFESIPPEGLKAAFTVKGLGKDPVVFEVPVREAAPAVYVCPMKCKNIEYTDPGACSVCGMALHRVPAETAGSGDAKHEGHDHR